jgi:general secretion pathway protein L
MTSLRNITLKAPSLPGSLLLDRYLRRWRGALFRCLPRAVRLWVARRRPVLVVSPHGDDAQLSLELLGERESIGGIDLRTSGSLKDVVGNSKQTWAATLLELPASKVLLRKVQLPVQVADNLRRVVTYEIDRLTPFQVAEVYFDVRVAGTVARGSKLSAELAVCRRDEVAEWLDRLKESAISPSILTWPGAWPGANLLPLSERPRRKRLGTLVTGALVCIVGGLAAAVLASPIWQKDQEQEVLARALRSTRLEAEKVRVLRDELERARLGSVEVLRNKRAQPRMTDLLRELTDLLPDGTWVQTMNYREGDVDIRGESTQATALIGLLEQGPGISDVGFRSPVMQVANTGQERFHISFQYTRPQQQ